MKWILIWKVYFVIIASCRIWPWHALTIGALYWDALYPVCELSLCSCVPFSQHTIIGTDSPNRESESDNLATLEMCPCLNSKSRYLHRSSFHQICVYNSALTMIYSWPCLLEVLAAMTVITVMDGARDCSRIIFFHLFLHLHRTRN